MKRKVRPYICLFSYVRLDLTDVRILQIYYYMCARYMCRYIVYARTL
jgi:hypothetical protein